jgi:hypothetical protein
MQLIIPVECLWELYVPLAEILIEIILSTSERISIA